VSNVHYPQFCALARAAELIGERWTLLIIRELLLEPRRFGDLLDHLDDFADSAACGIDRK
jgi:DNA-binding HxlR family transcriptional regulator